MGHYKSYVRRANGFWEVHDDLCRKINVLKSERIEITPHALFFVRCD